MKKLILLFFILFSLVFIVGTIHAQESPQDLAKKHGISFPISELGGCKDYSSCRTFCEDPVNQVSCINFAKAKGFYKEEEISKKDELLAQAKSELGCESESTCRSICEKEENFEKCSNFAKNHNLTGGHVEYPSSRQILEKAKQILGCDSPSSCMSFCSQEGNREKCSDFAKEAGIRGGEQHAGPGGCNSEETCKAFCSDPNNYQICSQYGSAEGGRFSGPGGCNSEESCRAFCSEHREECGEFGGGDSGHNYNPEEMCNKTPNCSYANNSCQCGSFGGSGEDQRGEGNDYVKFCSENPEKCKGTNDGSFNINQEDFCRQNPDKCRPPEDIQYQQPPEQYQAPESFNQSLPSFQDSTTQNFSN